jgi:hypothetical protein
MAGRLTFSFATVNAFLLRKQHLDPATRIPDVVQIARDSAGLHSTSGLTPYLSLFNRSPRFERAELDRELRERRSLARIRCIRGTIYIQPREWIPAFLAATRRRNTAQTVNLSRYSGVTDRQYASLSGEIAAVLAGKPMTAGAIRSALSLQGEISSTLYRMCDEGILLREQGEQGWKDRSVYYRLFREVFPEVRAVSIEETEAVAAVVEQYLRCFGPASEADIAWWSGFGRSEVRGALAALKSRWTLVGLGEDRRPAMLLKEDVEGLAAMRPREGPIVCLLPLLDGYLMGYRERDRYLRPEDRDFVFDRGGNATSTILVDGAVVGVWDWEEDPRPVVKIHHLSKVSKDVHARIEEEARRMGRFLVGREADLLRCQSMAPLDTRPAGGFQSPLRKA